MSKDSVYDWSTTAADNTDIGGIGITGNDFPRNLDDAQRELMSQIKEWANALGLSSGDAVAKLGSANTFTANQTFSGTAPTLSWTDTDVSNLVHMVRSFANDLSIDADVNNVNVSTVLRFRIGGSAVGNFDRNAHFYSVGNVYSGGSNFYFGTDTSNDRINFDDSTNLFQFFADGSVASGTLFSGGFATATSAISDGASYVGSGVAINYATGASVFSRAGDVAMTVNRSTSNGTSVSYRRSGTEVGSVSVTTTATTYNTSSDYRLKYGIMELTGSGAFIDALRPVSGKWIADDSAFVGFLAHEFAEVSPSSVTGEKDAEEDIGKATIEKNGELRVLVDILERDAPEGWAWEKTGTRPVMQKMQASSPEVMAHIIAELQSLRRRVAALEN